MGNYEMTSQHLSQQLLICRIAVNASLELNPKRELEAKRRFRVDMPHARYRFEHKTLSSFQEAWNSQQ